MGLGRGIELLRLGNAYRKRTNLGRARVMKHLKARDPSTVPMPTFVQLRVTNLCNLRCKMCGQWGDTGIYRADGFSASATDGEKERDRIRELIGARRQLALSDYVRLLDELAPHQPVISLYGGEPFLYPDILPLVREVKKRGLLLTVITNSGRLEQHARDLVEAGIDVVAVSIDGPPDVHNRIRGKPDSYQRAVDGIRAVARWRKDLGRPMPMQMAILPITELNADEIRPAIEALNEVPLDAVNLGLRWFVPQEVGGRYEQVMKETFGVTGDSWKGFDWSWAGAGDAEAQRMTQLVKLLKGIKRRRLLDAALGRPWPSFVPDVQPDDVPRWFADHGETFGHDLCPVAWYFAQVEPDGQVCFCGDFPDYFIGNVREQAFSAIWNSPKANAFRDHLAKQPLPICARCCGNFIYGRWPRPD